MNVDSVRAYCLSFPQARENLQWGETLCLKVGGKIFVTLSLDSVPPTLCLKCTPEKFVELVEQEGIRPAPYVGRYKWVLLERLDVLGDEELEDLIRQSYQMVAAKTKAKRKAESENLTAPQFDSHSLPTLASEVRPQSSIPCDTSATQPSCCFWQCC
jgi:predicted DNA-binding protein (MmcQ/YjbR family)